MSYSIILVCLLFNRQKNSGAVVVSKWHCSTLSRHLGSVDSRPTFRVCAESWDLGWWEITAGSPQKFHGPLPGPVVERIHKLNGLLLFSVVKRCYMWFIRFKHCWSVQFCIRPDRLQRRWAAACILKDFYIRNR